VLLGFSIAALWLAGNPVAWKAIIDAVQAVVPGLIGEDAVVKPSELRRPLSFSIAGAVSIVALTGSALGAIGSLRTAVRVLAGTAQDDILWIWVMLRNLLLAVGIGAAFVFGLCMDVHQSSMLGQHALSYTTLGFFAITIHRRLLWYPVLSQALQVLPLFALSQLIEVVTRMIGGGVFPGWTVLISPAIEAALWPLATALLLAPQRRTPEPDENRPL